MEHGNDVAIAVGLDRLHQADLDVILLMAFGRSHINPDDPLVVVHEASDGSRLRATYTKRGALAALSADGFCSDVVIDALRTKIDAEAAVDGHGVVRDWCFANVPVEGGWRFADRIQVTPAPPEAPRPDQTLALHPFIIEARFDQADDVMLRQGRAANAVREAELLLHAFLSAGIQALRPQGVKTWVLEGEVPGGWQTRFRQISYFASGAPATGEQLSPPGQECEVVPLADYRNRVGIGTGDVFVVHDELDAMCDAYWRLEPSLQQAFLRSASWLQHASLVGTYRTPRPISPWLRRSRPWSRRARRQESATNAIGHSSLARPHSLLTSSRSTPQMCQKNDGSSSMACARS